MNAAYLGPRASFSHQAALEIFCHSAVQVEALPTFADIFEGVQSSQYDYGVVPFENSSNGSVVQLLDLLADHQMKYSDVKVCAEHYLPVHHQLLVKQSGLNAARHAGLGEAINRIKKIYTHPQVWGQCSAFLSRVECRPVAKQDSSSTSEAARMVSEDEDGTSAAIASELAGKEYGLVTLADNIEDKGDNTTRFFVLARTNSSAYGGRQEDGVRDSKVHKSLVSFTITHESPGALADALSVFKKYEFNLTSINTRPSRLRPWHYIFFAECEQVRLLQSANAISSLISDLKSVALTGRHLGSWEDQLMLW
jgi:prephenate dehydratase